VVVKNEKGVGGGEKKRMKVKGVQGFRGGLTGSLKGGAPS